MRQQCLHKKEPQISPIMIHVKNLYHKLQTKKDITGNFSDDKSIIVDFAEAKS